MLKIAFISLAFIVIIYVWHNQHTYENKPETVKRFISVKDKAQTKYDYYKYAVEWPGSACYHWDCDYDNLGTSQWNQHGVWPNAWTTWHIDGCSQEKWNINAFSRPELDEIKSFWDGMYSSNEGFWEHEWSKHGTCWNPNLGDLSTMKADVRTPTQNARNDYKLDKPMIIHYFHTVYEAHKGLDFYKALADSGITPDNEKSRPLEDYAKAFQKSFGIKNVDLICWDTKDKKTLLNEVRICLDLNYSVMECPDEEITSD